MEHEKWVLEDPVLGMVFVGASFVIFYLIGWYSQRAAKSSTDYWTAGRSIGSITNGLGMASSYMSLATFMGVTALILKLKVPFVYMWIQFALSIPLITLWYGTPLRRMGAFTPAHFVRERYGVRTSYVTVFFMILIMVMYALGQMIGVAKVFEMLFGINYNLALICGGALIVGYVTIGGMYGTSYNAAFQMILMGVAFVVPLGAIMKAMGGTGWWFPPLFYSDMVPAMLEAVPDFFDMKYGFKWYLSLIPCFTLGAMGLPHLGMRVYTSANLKSARGAMVWFTFFCGIVFCSTYTMGFSGVYFQATSGSAIAPTDFDKITLILNSVYNPAWVLAFVIAGAIAAGLSTISANLMAIGAMIAQDIIATIKPDLSDKTMKVIGYLAIAGGGATSILIALNPPDFLVVSILWAFGLAGVTVAPLVMLGVWWKPANRYGATVACLVSGVTYIVVAPYFFPSIVVGGGLEAKVGMTGSLLCAPLCFFLLTTVSMITNNIPALMNRYDYKKDHVLIDKIHGWSDYSEERYNSNTAGIIVAAVSLFFCIYAVLPGGW
ncbi:MAG: sodium:solute symporter [Desulfofustis sp.]|nr:sodium:solute symporter [Desulfofustis sp.]NNK14480.1 sodium:solute symporter [Desulfofustis sp.]NNK58228.1 sodium:solute symporter [Desulfofustis sp.]RZW27395.1 MAG: sodium:solute symporter [Desulfobulbaceae bacterium]